MRLLIKTIDDKILEFETKKNSFIIGRSAKCDIVISHEGISRQHCQVDVTDGEVYITDLDSRNGVFIEDKKIEPGVKTHYPLYLILSFGAVQSMEIELQIPRTHTSSRIRTNVTLTSPELTNPDESTENKVKPTKKPRDPAKIRIILMSVLLFIGLLIIYYMESRPTHVEPQTPEEMYED